MRRCHAGVSIQGFATRLPGGTAVTETSIGGWDATGGESAASGTAETVVDPVGGSGIASREQQKFRTIELTCRSAPLKVKNVVYSPNSAGSCLHRDAVARHVRTWHCGHSCATDVVQPSTERQPQTDGGRTSSRSHTSPSEPLLLARQVLGIELLRLPTWQSEAGLDVLSRNTTTLRSSTCPSLFPCASCP